jgi:hypothetical protein
MARGVAIFLGIWVAISIPTGIVLGRLIAAASRLPHSTPPELWTPEPQPSRPKPRAVGTPKLWTLKRERRAARSRELLAIH